MRNMYPYRSLARMLRKSRSIRAWTGTHGNNHMNKSSLSVDVPIELICIWYVSAFQTKRKNMYSDCIDT